MVFIRFGGFGCGFAAVRLCGSLLSVYSVEGLAKLVKIFFQEKIRLLTTVYDCVRLVLGGASSSANSCKNPCYGRTRPEVVAGSLMQIYQNAGRARLAERAVLVLDRSSVSSAKSVVNPFFLLSQRSPSVVSSVAVLLRWCKAVIWPAHYELHLSHYCRWLVSKHTLKPENMDRP